MASPTIRFKRGAFANLPSLLAGEPGFTTDRSDFYVGGSDGNKFFGSARYWDRETGSESAVLKLVNAAGSGSINLKASSGHSGITTYTLPSTPTAGYFLKTNALGELTWESVTSGATFEGATLTNTTFSGISTFGGAIDANAGMDVTGGSTLDNLNVTGVGTIATADINGGNIDGTTIGATSAAAGTFTELSYTNSTSSGISTVGSLYAGSDKVLSVEGLNGLTLSNIDAIDSVTKATLEQTLSLDPNDFDSLNVSGIGTIGGLLDANGGLDVTGHTELDSLNVTGLSTFTGITTFTNDVYVKDTLYVGGITISGVAGTTFLGEDISVRNVSASGVSTFTGLVDANGGLDVTGHSELDNLNVTGVATFTQLVDANIDGNAGTATALQTGRNIAVSGIVTGTAYFDGTADITIATTIQNSVIGLGTHTYGQYAKTVAGGNGLTATTPNADDATEYTLTVGAGTGITVNADDVALKNAGELSNNKVIKWDSANGQVVNSLLTDNGSTVTVAGNATITGNLTVNGTTTQVNTTELAVYDRTITLGIQTGATPADTSWDLGVLMNYGEAGVAKTAGFVWDFGTKRFQFASNADNPAVGVNTTTPDITVSAFAPIEIGGLYVNNACSGGVQEVIGCANGELSLMNIVVDGGLFA
jgi:hypothetical protein